LSRVILDALTKYEDLQTARVNAQGVRDVTGESHRSVVGQSIDEADEIMAEFRGKFGSLMESGNAILFRDRRVDELRQSSMSMYSSQVAGVNDSLEVSAVLEKYSDRLMEMVNVKMLSKLNA
jgi:hypothetical protein